MQRMEDANAGIGGVRMVRVFRLATRLRTTRRGMAAASVGWVWRYCSIAATEGSSRGRGVPVDGYVCNHPGVYCNMISPLTYFL